MKNSLLVRQISLYGFFVLLMMACLIHPAWSQDSQVIKGQVKTTDGETLPGVTLVIKGTTNGTTTDMDGNFTLKASKGEVLVCSFIGFQTSEITLGSETFLNLTMELDLKQLDEVVVVGYGTQKKSHVTGAISKVVNDKLDQMPLSRADDALVGRVSGVNIQATGGDGVGSAPTIRIRGNGSITGSSDPLLVVDGVMVDSDFWTSIDMNDVESVEVLKDAASASIFGSRGANGVIMVTTKQGKSGAVKFSYNGFYGVQDVARNPDYNTSMADAIKAEMAETGELSDRTRYKQLLGVDTDWQDVIFNGGVTQSHTVSARGGSDRTTFSTAMTYMHDEGVLLTDDFKKYNFKAQVNTKVSDKFSMGVSVNPSYTSRRRFDGSTHDILRQEPWLPIYHDDYTIQFVDRNTYPDVQVGDYALQRHFDNYDLDGDGQLIDISTTSNTNPAAKILERDRRDNKFKLFGKIDGAYKILDDLTLSGAFSGTYQSSEYSRWQGVQSSRNGASAAQADYSTENSYRLIGQSFLDYKKSFGHHNLSMVLGVLSERSFARYSSMQGTGYENDLIQNVSGASTITSASSYEIERTLLSYISRFTYDFEDKYLLSLSIRRDGSSTFGEDNKFGNFSAISAGWRISEEAFLQGSKLLDNLKLRVSYGVTGNDNINVNEGGLNGRLVSNYGYTSLLTSSSYVVDGQILPGFNPANVANPLLGWERSIEINPAIDFGFFEGVISGSVDVYRRTSDNLLLDLPISGTTGFNTALVNRGKVKNEGIEFELTTNNFRKGKFIWSTTFLGSRNKNTLVDFAESNGQITIEDDKRASEWINLEGHPISSFYGYVVDSDIPLEYIKDPYHPIGAQAQDVYVRDLNGDGVIDGDDRTILGDPYPDFIWSVTNNFEIGQFDISFMFQGSHGAQVRNMADQYLYNHFNSAQDYDPATTPNQAFIKEKIFTSDIIQDASYIAFRTINVGYKLPKKLLGKAGFNSARVYISGQNLLYLDAKGYTGFNPEALDNTAPTRYGYQVGGAPIPRKIVMGVSLDF